MGASRPASWRSAPTGPRAAMAERTEARSATSQGTGKAATPRAALRGAFARSASAAREEDAVRGGADAARGAGDRGHLGHGGSCPGDGPASETPGPARRLGQAAGTGGAVAGIVLTATLVAAASGGTGQELLTVVATIILGEHLAPKRARVRVGLDPGHAPARHLQRRAHAPRRVEPVAGSRAWRHVRRCHRPRPDRHPVEPMGAPSGGRRVPGSTGARTSPGRPFAPRCAHGAALRRSLPKRGGADGLLAHRLPVATWLWPMLAVWAVRPGSAPTTRPTRWSEPSCPAWRGAPASPTSSCPPASALPKGARGTASPRRWPDPGRRRGAVRAASRLADRTADHTAAVLVVPPRRLPRLDASVRRHERRVVAVARPLTPFAGVGVGFLGFGRIALGGGRPPRALRLPPPRPRSLAGRPPPGRPLREPARTAGRGRRAVPPGPLHVRRTGRRRTRGADADAAPCRPARGDLVKA